jgi:membrane protease YdiL (CAAX protease family)
MTDSPTSTSRRADVCAVLFGLTFPTLVTWVYFVWLKESAPSQQQIAYGAGKVLQFGFPLVWVLAVQRRPLGLTRPNPRGLGMGVVFGMLVLAAMLILYHTWLKPTGYLDAHSSAGKEIYGKVAGFGIDTVWKYAGLGAFYALFHSLLEEYYWRWFVFGQLRRLVSLPAAIVVSSLGFMAHHVIVLGAYFGGFSLATVVFSLAVAVGGAVWAWLYQKSESLWAPWLSHLVVDAAIFIVGYDLVRQMLS